MHLGYAGAFDEGHPVHAVLRRLQPGDPLFLRLQARHGVGLHDAAGTCVARLSRKAETVWMERLDNVREVRVLAMVGRRAEQDVEPVRREKYAVAGWEVPMVEVVSVAGRMARK
jgi:ATP-dependent DNA helicase RecQ